MPADPKIRYCRTTDGVAIAYTVVGEGPPLLYARRFLAPGLDDELVFSFSNWKPLTSVRSIVLWDQRGTGLSGTAPVATFDDWLCDMEAVVAALRVERLDLAAELTPCHFAVSFAARHPEMVDRVVLWNPPPKGFSPGSRQPQWLRDLANIDWDAFADVSTFRMWGWNGGEAAVRFAKRLKEQFDADKYARLMHTIESIETDEATAVRAATLILADQNFFLEQDGHASSAARQEYMRWLAAEIPGGELCVIKPGDRAEAGRIAERFLEPAFVARGSGTPGGAGTGTAIVLFADIADSTAMTERLGDAAFRAKARTLDEVLRGCVREHGGNVIDAKTLGDGILATFTSASQGIAAALACGAAGEAQGLPLHLGLHAGDVIREGDANGGWNVFGGAVNIAARISALSAPGEVLVSDVVRALARTSAGVVFEDRGEHALKGVADAHRVWAVIPAVRPAVPATEQ